MKSKSDARRLVSSGGVYVNNIRAEDVAACVETSQVIDGRFVVPGAVEIFTNRGSRTLEIRAGDTPLAGFLVPLDGAPQPGHLTWSEWLPLSPVPAASIWLRPPFSSWVNRTWMEPSLVW